VVVLVLVVLAALTKSVVLILTTPVESGLIQTATSTLPTRTEWQQR
jgi:hypothetical protein